MTTIKDIETDPNLFTPDRSFVGTHVFKDDEISWGNYYNRETMTLWYFDELEDGTVITYCPDHV